MGIRLRPLYVMFVRAYLAAGRAFRRGAQWAALGRLVDAKPGELDRLCLGLIACDWDGGGLRCRSLDPGGAAIRIAVRLRRSRRLRWC